MQDVFEELYGVITDRRVNPADGSYTAYLFEKGLDKQLKKLGEETAETIIAAKNDSDEDLIGEISDLIFHLEVVMAQRGITPTDVANELRRRSLKTGNLKQMHVADKNS